MIRKISTLYIYTHTRRRILSCVLLLLLSFVAVTSQGRCVMKADSVAVDISNNAQVEEPDSLEQLLVDSLTGDTLQSDSLPWPLSLQKRLDTIIEKSSFLEHSQLGLMVYDLTADSLLYEVNARQTMRPASTRKILTAVTALDKLGGSYQFKTYLRYTGEVIDSTRTLKGDIYIVGGMDPRFNRDDLLAFVESVKKLGVDTIRGNVYADRSMKDKDLLGEGWCWDDDNPVLSPLVYSRKDQFLQKFLAELDNEDILLIGLTDDKVAPSSSKTICVRSHSMDQILMKMMKDSDNLYAEALFYQTASTQGKPAKVSGARAVENALIRKMKLNPSDYKIADGSGLSLYNYVTPELEVAFLQYAYRNNNIYNHLHPSLPIAGVDGTLAKRMKKTSAAGNVRAKTGTLTGISSLAGYVKAANDHDLAFCIINQGVLKSASAKNFQDKVCIALTN